MPLVKCQRLGRCDELPASSFQLPASGFRLAGLRVAACVLRVRLEAGIWKLVSTLRALDDRSGSRDVGHFPGEPSSTIRITGAGTEAEAWHVLTRALGLAGATAGQRPSAPTSGAPPFDGVVRRIGRNKHLEMLVVLEQATSGAALFGVYTWNKQVIVAISLYLYGPHAAEIVTRDEPLWRAWMAQASLTIPS